MQTFQLKTWSPSHKNTLHQFYLLSKGNNTGKPLDQPCPNCFVINCCSAEEKDKYYWLCYALWESGIIRPFLGGSVIVFIHINDLRKLIMQHNRQIEHSNCKDFVSMLTRLNTYEVNMRNQLAKASALKRSLAQAYLKPR